MVDNTMNITTLKNNKRDTRRIKQILLVLTKFGFGYFVELMKLKSKLPFAKRFCKYKSLEEFDSTIPERIRSVLEELGSTFIKFGQILSTREDLIGESFAKEFSKLQDDTPPFSYDIIKSTIKAELGSSINSLFAEFDKQPLASASIGQVHKAVLKNGKKIVVKVQRPNLSIQIKEDIRILRYLASLIERHIPDLKYYHLNEIIDEFERSIMKEIDYYQEKMNIKRFEAMFKDDKNIFVPKVYDKYSTQKVLTMQFVKGIKITNLTKYKKRYDNKLIARRGVESFFKQVLVHGFFHADPHPGNILILKNNVICFLDFGMMSHIDQDFIDNLAHLFVFLIDYNVNGLINQLTNMGLINETVDIKSFKYDVMDIMDLYYGSQLKEMRFGDIIHKLMMLLVKYKISLPKEMVLLSRALAIIESVGKTLDPKLNIVEVCKPFSKKVIKQKISPRRLADFIKENLFEFEHIMKILPRSLKETLNKIISGKIKVDFEHKNLDVFSDNLERVSNKLSIAMIISAVIIGSSLIIQTNKGFLLFGFPLLGVLGFIISAIIGFGLIISILRFKK